MGFENLANRINSLTNFDIFEKPPADYKEVSTLTVLDEEMQKKTVTRANFLKLMTRDFILLTELLPCPSATPV